MREALAARHQSRRKALARVRGAHGLEVDLEQPLERELLFALEVLGRPQQQPARVLEGRRAVAS